MTNIAIAITGDGNILKGSGSSSIFYTMITTLLFMLFYYVPTKNISLGMWSKTAIKGARKLFPIAMILLFAFAIGKVTTELKTGLYLASLVSEGLSVYLLAGVIFLLSSLMAFSTFRLASFILKCLIKSTIILSFTRWEKASIGI